jgi:hypothetical protein
MMKGFSMAQGQLTRTRPQAGSTAFGIRCSESNAKIWSYELVLELRETMYNDSISPDVAFCSSSCASEKNASYLHFCSRSSRL